MSTFNYQLVLESKESITSPVQNDNKQHCQCEYGQTSSSDDRRHHNIRLRKLILPAILVLLTLGGLLVWSYVNWHGRSTWDVDGLVGRDEAEDKKANKIPTIIGLSLGSGGFGILALFGAYWVYKGKKRSSGGCC